MILHTHNNFFSKKINWDLFKKGRIQYDSGRTFSSNSTIFTEPMNHTPDYKIAQRLVIADFFSRLHSMPLSLISNPSLHHIESLDAEFLWHVREEITFKTTQLLDLLSIGYDNLSSLSNISAIEQLHNITLDLSDNNMLSYRKDVCYYNIYTGTVVPDHRVHHTVVEGHRYYIRFFIDSKKDTLVAYIDNPYLLFGCVAILVNPLDKRYKRFIGKNVLIPLINKNIPVIAHTSVSIEGFGAHMLIPAHNRSDFHIALELGLPYDVYSVDKFGNFTAVAKDFQGKHKDEFEDNIIQFIDDISNLEKKESISLVSPIDSMTGDILLPLLQKNIYLSLTDASLEDQTLVTKTSFVGDSTHLNNQIEYDERWCISTSDRSQISLPFYLTDTDNLEKIQFSDQSLLFRLIKDLVLLNVISLPAQSDVIIQGFSLVIENKPLRKHLIDIHAQYYESSVVIEINNLLSILSDESKNHDYSESIEQILHLLDASDGILFTQQGYTFDPHLFPYQYDHEYVSISLFYNIVNGLQNKNITCFYSDTNSDWIKYILYLYRIIHKEKIKSVNLINIFDQFAPIDLSSLESYPGDVIRLFMISQSTIGENENKNDYNCNYLYRFVNKWRNASRMLWGPLDQKFVFTSQGLDDALAACSQDFSDYDTWIITRFRYIWDEVNYHIDKRSLSTALKFVVESLRYDFSEYTLFINKYYTSDSTLFVSRFVVIISIHILYPFAPTLALGMCSLLGITLQPQLISEFFERYQIQKNYKSTMMMDVIHQWSELLREHTVITDSSTLILQSNKDFSNYVEQNKNFIVQYFGGEDKINISFLYEGEALPEESIMKDLLTMKIAIEKNNSTVVTAIPQTAPSLTVLQGQLEYKKQLLQTMRNTVTRLRSSLGNEDTIIQLQSEIDELTKSIEVLDYQISKLKYF